MKGMRGAKGVSSLRMREGWGMQLMSHDASSGRHVHIVNPSSLEITALKARTRSRPELMALATSSRPSVSRLSMSTATPALVMPRLMA